MVRSACVLGVLLLLGVLVPCSAEDWPEFRGPTGQGHSSEQGLPFEWSESRNVVWKTRVTGSGWSSPPGELHRVIARRDYTAIEVSTPELDDVIRWQDDTGRGHGRIESEHAGDGR